MFFVSWEPRRLMELSIIVTAIFRRWRKQIAHHYLKVEQSQKREISLFSLCAFPQEHNQICKQRLRKNFHL